MTLARDLTTSQRGVDSVLTGLGLGAALAVQAESTWRGHLFTMWSVACRRCHRIGIEWVGRVMRAHLHLNSAAGGKFIETRANFAVQSGEYLQAARFYAAARTQTRRAAMVWPRRSMTEELLRRRQSHLSAADYEHAWKEGERLTLEEVVNLTGQ